MKELCLDKFKQTHVELFRNDSEKLLFDLETRYREIGWLGSWIASSNKREHAVDEIRSFDLVREAFQRFTLKRASPPYGWEVYVARLYPTGYWQSEGKPPHFIKCAFHALVKINQIAIYLDFPNDQSYTPLKLTVYWGMCPFEFFLMDSNNTRQFSVVIGEPSGWVGLMNNSDNESTCPLIVAKCLTITVMENHRGGNDTRIRQIRLYTNTLHTL